MGKRKSKTSKQKQAKASAKSLKAHVIKEPLTKKKHQDTGDGMRSSSPSSDFALKGKHNKNAIQNSSSSEANDFQRQQDSMRERMMASVQKEERQKQKQKGRRKGQQSKTQQIQGAFAFSAPTLIVDDARKSTTQLMSEVTDKTQGWNGMMINDGNNSISVPQQPQQQQQHKAISLQHVYQTNQQQQQMQARKNRKLAQSKNAFAVLGDNSDDENDNGSNKNSGNQTSVFQFAPASFSVAAPAVEVGAAPDIDPDL